MVLELRDHVRNLPELPDQFRKFPDLVWEFRDQVQRFPQHVRKLSDKIRELILGFDPEASGVREAALPDLVRQLPEQIQ